MCWKKVAIISAVVLLMTILLVSPAMASLRVSGAIFTTIKDGSRVNANIYDNKDNVYLDGGPGQNAPQNAAGLPDGDYYFQVTDPSGKVLLSADPVESRKIRVANGIINYIYPAPTQTKFKGLWWGTHATGTDIDHGALTVQLMPYADTPNMGGVYKAWITPCQQYSPGNGFYGFIPAWSKTDNFKVKKGRPSIPPVITGKKFHDANINGIKDTDEEWITGWMVSGADPLGGTNNYFTPFSVLADEGAWAFNEDSPAGTRQTASYRDGILLSQYPSANPSIPVIVAGISGETHEIIYGNVGLGSITARKVYDRNGNGREDSDEPGVMGWRMQLTGTTINGSTVGPIVQTTGSNGNTTFTGLLPGEYTITEIMPIGSCWRASSATSARVTIKSTLIGSNIIGTVTTCVFTNYCIGQADFDTKGYWHNKNGLAEITDADIDYVNGLAPYALASSYFGAGDEPFDGYFSDGNPVSAANGSWGEEIAPAGSVKAEISHFLVDANASGDSREQLAQQLLAFIFNTRHRGSGAVQMPDGSWKSTGDIISEANNLWQNGPDSERTSMSGLLDWFNNNNAVNIICANPCPVVY